MEPSTAAKRWRGWECAHEQRLLLIEDQEARDEHEIAAPAARASPTARPMACDPPVIKCKLAAEIQVHNALM
jgi:hypothetical protein